ncbi:hypothetical protein ACFSX9_00445 [Flavobacterium ardleyense]|uniref:Uncharacterized protein n=1 Tax=Flavobacterium ardleyense TaxID=2038737 RepID=A0ABW5Z353_9FLAO
MKIDFNFSPNSTLSFHNYIKTDYNNRFNSWKNCYEAFADINQDENVLALHLGFYLASWGMYRGSAAIFQKDYTIHIKAVQIIKDFYDLRCDTILEVTSLDISRIIYLTKALYKHYNSLQYMMKEELVDRKPTDTLISKIIIGTLGCSPAFDRYYNNGVKANGFTFNKMNEKSYKELFQFVEDNKADLIKLQQELYKIDTIHYPLLKVVDMYFWHEGYNL